MRGLKKCALCLAALALLPTASEALATADQSPGLKIFWWNISAGPNQAHHPALEQSLNASLAALIHSPQAPDVVALTLFRASALDSKLLAQLSTLYRHNGLYSFPGSPGYGIAVFSRWPMSLLASHDLDFTPPDLTSEEQRAAYRKDWCGDVDYCTRQFLLFQIHWQNENIYFVPAHLFDVWRPFHAKYSKIRTAYEVHGGTDNALWYQLQRFRQSLDGYFGPTLAESKLVVVGDFNLPRRLPFSPLLTRGFSELTRGLRSAFSRQIPTFPAAASPDYDRFPSLQIDHAFVGGGLIVTSSRVMRFRGSNHYPISLVVRPAIRQQSGI